MDASTRFGVELKSTAGQDVKQTDESKVDRAKASIFTWDDEGLQKTAVVQKKINKSAVTVQRFIRACISHWKYFNEEKGPLLEELNDCKRRHAEELEEVKAFKQRGFEEARFELEAEMAMPAELYEESQKLSKQLKQGIKDEEEAIHQYEKYILEENQRTKKLNREKHEIEAQETLSRLDVEIPALEAEHLELEGANEEFGEIVDALKDQLKDMNKHIALEESHKKRLIQTMAKMLKELAARGAKPKVINAVKLALKEVTEALNPKPPAPKPKEAPAPGPPKAEPAPEAAPGPPKTETQQKSSPPKSFVSSSDDDTDSSSDSSTSTSSSSEVETFSKTRPKTRKDMAFRASAPPRSSAGLRQSTGSTEAPQKPDVVTRAATDGVKRKSIKKSKTEWGDPEMASPSKARAARQLRKPIKKSKSWDLDKEGSESFNWGDPEVVRRASSIEAEGNASIRASIEAQGGFDWGSSKAKKLVRRASIEGQKLLKHRKSRSRSLSPVPRKDKKKVKDKGSGSDGEKDSKKAKPRRTLSSDTESKAKMIAKLKKKVPSSSFDWSALGDDKKDHSEKSEKEKKEKKEKKSKKYKDKDKSKSKKKKKKDKDSSEKGGEFDSEVAQGGHFSWACHAK